MRPTTVPEELYVVALQAFGVEPFRVRALATVAAETTGRSRTQFLHAGPRDMKRRPDLFERVRRGWYRCRSKESRARAIVTVDHVRPEATAPDVR